jgi:Arc/MetJ-type ribon-helix-helix transcriptional regulator
MKILAYTSPARGHLYPLVPGLDELARRATRRADRPGDRGDRARRLPLAWSGISCDTDDIVVAPVPDWYHNGMSKQVAVRLPDDLVEFVDGVVRSGRARSRAAVVSRALERERRRAVAARDAAILAGTGPDDELAGLAEYAVELDRKL